MIRGLETGIKRVVTAKLCERGFSEGIAADLAAAKLDDATKFFNDRLSTHQRSGKPLELALDDSFVDLSRWAGDLAASLPSGSLGPT